MDKELEYRLARIEEKLTGKTANGLDSDFAKQQADDEIDLRELWNVIWAGRIKIIAITAVFAIASVIYALSLPNMYKSQLLLAPAQTDNKGGLGALAAQYGGLASIAGIDLNGGDDGRIEQAVQLLKSWPFLDDFVRKYNIKPQVMAVEYWNKKTNNLVYDPDIYDIENNIWTRDVNVEKGETPEPTSYETYEEISELISITVNEKTGLLTIAVEHYSANVAYEWVELLKQEINSFYQQQDMLEAQKNINYLKAKIAETNITEMQSVFYNMIESQTQTLMLAEVSDQYLVKTVVPAKVAEEKSKPKRALICVLGLMLGTMLGFMIVLITHFLKKIE